MPKVVEKSPNNPATLLLPKRPPANRPKAEESFEHALKNAQPKREVHSKPRPEPARPAREDAQPLPEPEAAASTDEQPTDAIAFPAGDEASVEDNPVPKIEAKEADAEIADLLVVAQAPDPLNLTPVINLPQVPLQATSTEVDDTQPVTATVASAPLKVSELPELGTRSDLPTQPVETDSLDELAQPASASIPAQQLIEDDVLDEGTESVQQPFAPIATKQPVARNAQQAAPTSDLVELPEEAVIPVDPIESEQPQVDDGAVKSEAPKLKLADPDIDTEAADDQSLQQLTPPPEAAHAKDSQAHSVAPREIDAVAPKAPVEAKSAVSAPLPPPPAPVRTDADFAATNHDRIVSSVRSQLLPNGGTMHLRLDPPELGALQIHVRMIDGVMQASFETSNDQATRMLSHSLSQLKTALETQGVSVDRLHVQQSPRDQQAGSSTEDQQRQSQQQDSQAQREQQRRELLNRMWRRMRLGRDPLDMVA